MTTSLEKLQNFPTWITASDLRALLPRGQRLKLAQLIETGVLRACTQDSVLWVSRDDALYALTCRRERKAALSHALRGTAPLTCASMTGHQVYQWACENGHTLALPAPPYLPPTEGMRASRRLAGVEERLGYLEGLVSSMFHALHAPARLRPLADADIFDLLTQAYAFTQATTFPLEDTERWLKTLEGLTTDHIVGLSQWATRYPCETQELCGKSKPYLLLLQVAYRIHHFLAAQGEGDSSSALTRLQRLATRVWESLTQLCHVQLTLEARLSRPTTLPAGASATERYLLEHL